MLFVWGFVCVVKGKCIHLEKKVVLRGDLNGAIEQASERSRVDCNMAR